MLGYPGNPKYRAATVSAARYAGLALPDRPSLAQWVIAVDLGDGRLQFRSTESSHTLNHPLLVRAYHTVEKLLDGQHTVEDIISVVDSDFQPQTVLFLLKLLHGKGLLQYGGDAVHDGWDDEVWKRQVRFLSHFVPNASRAQSELAKSRIGVVGSDDLRQAIVTALGSIGVDYITEMLEPPTWRTKADAGPTELDLLIACGVLPGFTLFNAVNRACLATRTRWLRVAISGMSAQLGPTVVPYETACYTCFDLRRQTHEAELDGYLAHRALADNINGVRDAGTAPLSSVVAGQVALEIARILIGYTAAVTFGRYYEFSAVSPVVTPHDVLRVPRCASCSSAPSYAEAWDQTVLPTVQT